MCFFRRLKTMRHLCLILSVVVVSVSLVSCRPNEHRPIDAYLAVESERGSPNPPVGDHYLNWGMSVTASVDSPLACGRGSRYFCAGWTGTGSVPAVGSINSVTFVITQNSSITWLWKTQYELRIEVFPEEDGTVQASPECEDSYYDEGIVLKMTASANPGYIVVVKKFVAMRRASL